MKHVLNLQHPRKPSLVVEYVHTDINSYKTIVKYMHLEVHHQRILVSD